MEEVCGKLEFEEPTAPTANFTAPKVEDCEGESFNFTSNATGDVTSYEWIFPGGTPSLSALENPTNITYQNPGQFDVTFIVHNSAGSDTLLQADYITVNGIPTQPTVTKTDSTLTSSAASGNQWYKNNVIMNGETNQSLFVVDNAQYKTRVTSNEGCQSTSSNFAVTDLGIDDQSTDEFILFPNPTDGLVSMEMNANGADIEVSIIDFNGKLIEKMNLSPTNKTHYEFEFNEKYASGAYLLNIKSERFNKNIAIQLERK